MRNRNHFNDVEPYDVRSTPAPHRRVWDGGPLCREGTTSFARGGRRGYEPDGGLLHLRSSEQACARLPLRQRLCRACGWTEGRPLLGDLGRVGHDRRTQFKVTVRRNVKGYLRGTVTVNQYGGGGRCTGDPRARHRSERRVELWEDDPLRKVGEAALFVTSYDSDRKWHTIVAKPFADRRIRSHGEGVRLATSSKGRPAVADQSRPDDLPRLAWLHSGWPAGERTANATRLLDVHGRRPERRGGPEPDDARSAAGDLHYSRLR